MEDLVELLRTNRLDLDRALWRRSVGVRWRCGNKGEKDEPVQRRRDDDRSRALAAVRARQKAWAAG
jgi:hypothetical protein